MTQEAAVTTDMLIRGVFGSTNYEFAELLQRPNTPINEVGKYGMTILEYTCRCGCIFRPLMIMQHASFDDEQIEKLMHPEVQLFVRVSLAYALLVSSRLVVPLDGIWDQPEHMNGPWIEFIRLSKTHPALARYRLRLTASRRLFLDLLRDVDHLRSIWASIVFASVLLSCDDYAVLNGKAVPNQRRFFAIVGKLPMDLQMLVCNRAAGRMSPAISVGDTNLALCSAFYDLG